MLWALILFWLMKLYSGAIGTNFSIKVVSVRKRKGNKINTNFGYLIAYKRWIRRKSRGTCNPIPGLIRPMKCMLTTPCIELTSCGGCVISLALAYVLQLSTQIVSVSTLKIICSSMSVFKINKKYKGFNSLDLEVLLIFCTNFNHLLNK